MITSFAGNMSPHICEDMEIVLSWVRAAKDYLKGFFLYGIIKGVYEEKRSLHNLFMLYLFGKTIGFPHLFNYYHLRLMPPYMRDFDRWKKDVLRERDFFDRIN
jgi:hypothetical protein